MFSSTIFNYKKKYDFKYREAEAIRIKLKHPDKNLIIVETKENNMKFLVPNEITMGQFNFLVRKRINLGPEKGLILMTYNGMIFPTSELISSIFNQYVDTDQILYIYATEENIFGY